MADEHPLSLRSMSNYYREMAKQLRELARRCRFRTGRGELVQLAATFDRRADRCDDGWH
jgi:hypothetical protein